MSECHKCGKKFSYWVNDDMSIICGNCGTENVSEIRLLQVELERLRDSEQFWLRQALGRELDDEETVADIIKQRDQALERVKVLTDKIKEKIRKVNVRDQGHRCEASTAIHAISQIIDSV